MDNKFDELTKAMAQSLTRRAAIKKFGVGLAGMSLACFGLANSAKAFGNANCATCLKGCELTGDSKESCKAYCKAIGRC
jgi:hypothetical protein